MKWNAKDLHEWEVVESSGWRKLENFGTFQDRAGVFIFTNADLHVKYIGKAGPGRIVKEIKSAISRGKSFGATKVKVLYTNSDKGAVSLKRKLLTKYKPVLNHG